MLSSSDWSGTFVNWNIFHYISLLDLYVIRLRMCHYIWWESTRQAYVSTYAQYCMFKFNTNMHPNLCDTVNMPVMDVTEVWANIGLNVSGIPIVSSTCEYWVSDMMTG